MQDDEDPVMDSRIHRLHVIRSLIPGAALHFSLSTKSPYRDNIVMVDLYDYILYNLSYNGHAGIEAISDLLLKEMAETNISKKIYNGMMFITNGSKELSEIRNEFKNKFEKAFG